MTNTFDKTVRSLCSEIDHLNEEVLYWKGKYEEEKKSYNKMLSDSLEESKKGIANALLFAISVEENGNGDLIIPKNKRKALAKRFKTRNPLKNK
jgi:hypothetical protein